MALYDTNSDELTAKGLAIFDIKLRAVLEPTHNNKYVAIHVDSGYYAIGRSWVAALRAIRERHAIDGRLVTMRIGTEPEYGLASRVLGATPSVQVQK
jgi:hypothetical protein